MAGPHSLLSTCHLFLSAWPLWSGLLCLNSLDEGKSLCCCHGLPEPGDLLWRLLRPSYLDGSAIWTRFSWWFSGSHLESSMYLPSPRSLIHLAGSQCWALPELLSPCGLSFSRRPAQLCMVVSSSKKWTNPKAQALFQPLLVSCLLLAKVGFKEVKINKNTPSPDGRSSKATLQRGIHTRMGGHCGHLFCNLSQWFYSFTHLVANVSKLELHIKVFSGKIT